MDELDTAIHVIMESMLEVPFTNEDPSMTEEDLDDIRVQLLTIDNILVFGFFNCIAYPLRLLRK